MPFGARALEQAKIIIQRTFNTTATVMRKVTERDNKGGYVTTYEEVYTYPCTFSRYQVTPVERPETTQTRAIALWMFVFAYGVDIVGTDRLVSGGRTFEVVSATSGSLEVATRVLCQEIV
jgi:hypothetical protein